MEKSRALNESLKGELLAARDRVQELEVAFQETSEKMMTSNPT